MSDNEFTFPYPGWQDDFFELAATNREPAMTTAKERALQAFTHGIGAGLNPTPSITNLNVVRKPDVPLGECWISEDTPPFPVIYDTVKPYKTVRLFHDGPWAGQHLVVDNQTARVSVMDGSYELIAEDFYWHEKAPAEAGA